MKDDQSADDPNTIQMGWKISDEPTTEPSTPAEQQSEEPEPEEYKNEKAQPQMSMEETKTYEEFKSKVTEQPFYGSDEEAYIDDDDEDEEDGVYEGNFNDDFDLSETGAPEFPDETIDIEELFDENDDEERERQFFGHAEYSLMSVAEEEEDEEAQMSATMQKKKYERVGSLRKEIDQLMGKIKMQKELGEHLAGKSVIF